MLFRNGFGLFLITEAYKSRGESQAPFGGMKLSSSREQGRAAMEFFTAIRGCWSKDDKECEKAFRHGGERFFIDVVYSVGR